MDIVTFRQHLAGANEGKSTKENIASNVWRSLGPEESIAFGWLDLLQKEKKLEVAVAGVTRMVDISDVTVKEEIHLSSQRGTSNSTADSGGSGSSPRASSVSSRSMSVERRSASGVVCMPVLYGDPVTIESFIDGATWTAKKELRGWISKRSNTECTPIFFNRVEKHEEVQKKKNKKRRSVVETSVGEEVCYGDVVVLCCNIQQQDDGKKKKKKKKGEKVINYAQLKLSKKGRCKWRFDEQPQKFVIVPVDHEDGISPKRNFHTLNMGDKYALQLVRAGKPRKRRIENSGEDDGEDYLGCHLHTLKTAKMRKEKAAKDHRHYRHGSTASSSASSTASNRSSKSDVLLRNSSMLALESLEASIQNIVVQGRSTRTHHLVCRSLATLPARTLFMYVDLHGSTRELMFALNDPSSKGDDDDEDEDDDDDTSSMISSTSTTLTTGGGRASSVHQATSSSSSSGGRSGAGGGGNAADYIEGGPNSAEVTLVLRGVVLSVIDSLRTELLFVTIENLSINLETDNGAFVLFFSKNILFLAVSTIKYIYIHVNILHVFTVS